MGSAADILVLRQHSLRLNWMNVIVEKGEEAESHQINLAELTLNQELQRSAVLVCFER
jgi:hypothetical protein